eukprot:545343_1
MSSTSNSEMQSNFSNNHRVSRKSVQLNNKPPKDRDVQSKPGQLDSPNDISMSSASTSESEISHKPAPQHIKIEPVEPDMRNPDYVRDSLGLSIYSREYLNCCLGLETFPAKEYKTLKNKYLTAQTRAVTRTRDLRSGNSQDLRLGTRRAPARIKGYPRLMELICASGKEVGFDAQRKRTLVYMRMFEQFMSKG